MHWTPLVNKIRINSVLYFLRLLYQRIKVEKSRVMGTVVISFFLKSVRSLLHSNLTHVTMRNRLCVASVNQRATSNKRQLTSNKSQTRSGRLVVSPTKYPKLVCLISETEISNERKVWVHSSQYEVLCVESVKHVYRLCFWSSMGFVEFQVSVSSSG